MNIDAKTINQLLTYFTIFGIFQVLIIVIMGYAFWRKLKHDNEVFQQKITQNFDKIHEIIMDTKYAQLEFQKFSNHQFNGIIEDLKNIEKKNIENSSNTHNETVYHVHNYNPYKVTEVIEDQQLSSLIQAYNHNRYSKNEVFIPLQKVINSLLDDKVVNSEEEAKKMINTLTKMYPSAIIIENVRGQKFPQIAIVN